MTTRPLSSAHRLNVALPGSRSMLSSVCSRPENQPSTWKEMMAQSTKVILSSQARIQLFGPSETLITCTAQRTSTSTVARSSAMSMSPVCKSNAREQRTETEYEQQADERRRQHHAGDHDAARPSRQVVAGREQGAASS